MVAAVDMRVSGSGNDHLANVIDPLGLIAGKFAAGICSFGRSRFLPKSDLKVPAEINGCVTMFVYVPAE
jgi:hypothetical protein